MFGDEIRSLELCCPEADQIFKNITATAVGGDVSLCGTLRALLIGRVPEGESVTAQVSPVYLSSGSDSDKISGILSNFNYGGNGRLNICNLGGRLEDNQYALSLFDDEGNIEQWLPGYVSDKVLKDFFGMRKLYCRVLTNASLKSTLIIVSNMDTRRLHLLQSTMTRYFPWYFSEKPVTEDDVKLLTTLTGKNSEDYIAAVNQVAKQFDFRSMRIRALLTGFEKVADEQTLREIDGQIETYRSSIRALQEQFSELYRSIDLASTRKIGLTEKLSRKSQSDEDGELIHYMLHNKSVDLVSVVEGTIRFIVHTTISSFDPDVFEKYFSRENSFFFLSDSGSRYAGSLSHEDYVLMLKGIFQDEIIKLRVCAAYELNFVDGAFRGISDYAFPPQYSTYMPNWHIQRYACLGGNQTQISEAMVRRDFISAIEACYASACNISLSDSTVFGHFAKALVRNDRKCIELPDGSVVLPSEAVNWLKEEQKQ